MIGAMVEGWLGMPSFAILRAWAPLLGRGLLWTLVLGTFAHLGGATWNLRNGPPLRANWGWSALAAGAQAALSLRDVQALGTKPEARPCPSRAPKAVTADGRIILNAAGVRDLVRLPGVGAKRAEAILKVRQRLGGRFRSLRQLMRVRGIGPRSLKKLTPHLVLDAPEEPPKREADK